MISGTPKHIKDEVERRGLVETTFLIDPVLLPDNTPQDVVSAWLRLNGQGRKDVKTIERWLAGV
jgi:hypothetical protein